jgi:glycosyltransferase involved in cell wall biosynthesis
VFQIITAVSSLPSSCWYVKGCVTWQDRRSNLHKTCYTIINPDQWMGEAMMTTRSQQIPTGGLQPEIGYILRSFPRLSQTFVLHEILALERLGLKLRIFAIVDPHESLVQQEVGQVQAEVHYLAAPGRRRLTSIPREHLALCAKSPCRYFTTLCYVLRHGEIDRGYRVGSRLDCFRQAVYLLRLVAEAERRTGRRIHHLHAHFAHDPALIAMLAHMLSGIPYSFTAHARDLYQVLPQTLVDRVAQATAAVTCCAANVSYLRRILPRELGEKCTIVHYGIDLCRFHPGDEREESQRKGSALPLILSVGRLVEKKGFLDLVAACSLLKREGYRFRCEIYGEGQLRDELRVTLHQYDLAGQVVLAGGITQQELIPALQRADIFALTPFVTEDGDRDGMPNVLMEAMACGLPVVSTTVAGVPELIEHGYNGLLAQPRDVHGIAAALAALLGDTRARKRLGAAAHRTVMERFSLDASARRLTALFDRTPEDADVR